MKILIVDDERNIRTTLKAILADEGYQLRLARTGEEALELLAREAVDLVILDVKLPGLNGIDVFKSIKTDHPGLDVLMISGHGDIQTAVEAVQMGAYDFLEKPLSMAKILTAARNIQQKRRLLTQVAEDRTARQEKYQLVGDSPPMEKVRDLIGRVAPTESKVLIRGESGTGKELVAFAIHRHSKRAANPFISFNSAAIPAELVESELFGYEQGAFTGAEKRKLGKLELADGGTLFLDEIGDMHLPAQTKILRVIQEGTFERVGGNETIAIDVRLIAATHKNLEEMITEGGFREDLYYRLNVIPVTIPPLRERPGDVAALVEHFLGHYASELKMTPKKITAEALKQLADYSFPGNVRELKNIIERLYILVSGDTITATDLAPHLLLSPSAQEDTDREGGSFREAVTRFETRYLTEQLKRNRWNISAVARQLGLKQPNLSRKIKALGIIRSKE